MERAEMTEEELKLLKEFIISRMDLANLSDPERGPYNLGVYMAYNDVYNYLKKELYTREPNEDLICCNCGKELPGRFLFCSQTCEDVSNKEQKIQSE